MDDYTKLNIKNNFTNSSDARQFNPIVHWGSEVKLKQWGERGGGYKVTYCHLIYGEKKFLEILNFC